MCEEVFNDFFAVYLQCDAMASVPSFRFHGSTLERCGQQSDSNLARINFPQYLQNEEFTIVTTLTCSLEAKGGLGSNPVRGSLVGQEQAWNCHVNFP